MTINQSINQFTSGLFEGLSHAYANSHLVKPELLGNYQNSMTRLEIGLATIKLAHPLSYGNSHDCVTAN
jgi:hypothetical protein